MKRVDDAESGVGVRDADDLAGVDDVPKIDEVPKADETLAGDVGAEEGVRQPLEADPAPRGVPAELMARLRADPTHAPEHLALAAVEYAGPEAVRWIAAARQRHPRAAPAYFALKIRDRFTWQTRSSGAATGMLGLPGAVADTVFTAYVEARMVVFLAAAYGLDPTDRERAAEILVLTGVKEKLDAARTAIDVVAGRAAKEDLLAHGGASPWTVAGKLAVMVGGKLGKKALTKIVPVASIPLSAMSNARSTKQLARKAMRMYGGFHQPALPPTGTPPEPTN